MNCDICNLEWVDKNMFKGSTCVFCKPKDITAKKVKILKRVKEKNGYTTLYLASTKSQKHNVFTTSTTMR